MTDPEAPVRIVFAAPADPGTADEVRARSGAEVIEAGLLAGESLARAAASADILVTRSSQRIGESLLRGASGRLRAIVQPSAGTDNIDEREAAALGIAVVPVEPGNATSVAELTLMSAVAILRDVRHHWAETASGRWPDRERLEDRELCGRTIGLVGLGRVGSRVATRAAAFEMSVLAFDPYVEETRFTRHGAERRRDLEEMLRESEILSLHCPLTTETDGMIDARRLACLPPGAVLINTARGPIVDEAALVGALDRGELAGAAIDVFREEPAPAGGIASHPRVLPTPHMAGHTRDSHARRRAQLIESLVELAGRLREKGGEGEAGR